MTTTGEFEVDDIILLSTKFENVDPFTTKLNGSIVYLGNIEINGENKNLFIFAYRALVPSIDELNKLVNSKDVKSFLTQIHTPWVHAMYIDKDGQNHKDTWGSEMNHSCYGLFYTDDKDLYITQETVFKFIYFRRIYSFNKQASPEDPRIYIKDKKDVFIAFTSYNYYYKRNLQGKVIGDTFEVPVNVEYLFEFWRDNVEGEVIYDEPLIIGHNSVSVCNTVSPIEWRKNIAYNEVTNSYIDANNVLNGKREKHCEIKGSYIPSVIGELPTDYITRKVQTDHFSSIRMIFTDDVMKRVSYEYGHTTREIRYPSEDNYSIGVGHIKIKIPKNKSLADKFGNNIIFNKDGTGKSPNLDKVYLMILYLRNNWSQRIIAISKPFLLNIKYKYRGLHYNTVVNFPVNLSIIGNQLSIDLGVDDFLLYRLNIELNSIDWIYNLDSMAEDVYFRIPTDIKIINKTLTTSTETLGIDYLKDLEGRERYDDEQTRQYMMGIIDELKTSLTHKMPRFAGVGKPYI